MDEESLSKLSDFLKDITIDIDERMGVARTLALATSNESNELIFDFILSEGKKATYYWREVVEVIREKNNLARIYSQAWYKSIPETFRYQIRFSPLNEFQSRLRKAYFDAVAPFKQECCSVNQIKGDIVCMSDPSHAVTYLDVLKLLIAPNGGKLNMSSASIYNNWNPVDHEWFRRNGFL